MLVNKMTSKSTRRLSRTLSRKYQSQIQDLEAAAKDLEDSRGREIEDLDAKIEQLRLNKTP